MQNKSLQPKLSNLIIFFTLMLCPLLMGIDFLGIGVALPHMTKYFDVKTDSAHWLITLFAMGYVAFIITASRLADIYGRSRIFIYSIFLFAFSSLLVGAAINFSMALVGRFFQGVSCGAMIVVVVAIISDMFDDAERKNRMSTMVAMVGLGTAIGPLGGGVMIDLLSWRYLFLINIPIALLACVVAKLNFPKFPPKDRNAILDIPGIITLTIALSSFAITTSQFLSWGAASVNSIIMYIVFVLSLIAFFVVESKSANPLLRLRLFKTQNFMTGNIIAAVLYACLSAWVICAGLYFTAARDYSAIEVGLTFLPFGLSMIIINLFMPSINARFSSKPLVLFALFLSAFSFAWMSYSAVTFNNIAYYSIGAFCFGISFVMINSLSLPLSIEHLEKDDINVGAGMALMLRWVGSAVGAPVIATVFSSAVASVGYEHSLYKSYNILAILMVIAFMLTLFFVKQKQK